MVILKTVYVGTSQFGKQLKRTLHNFISLVLYSFWKNQLKGHIN